MLPPTALGELLIVGAVPAAAFLAIVAGILSRRYRRPAQVLMVLALLVAVAMIVAGRRLTAPFDALRKAQLERFTSVEIGAERATIEALLGPPGRKCAGPGADRHKVRGTPELLTRLYASTTERWIYFLPGTEAEVSPPLDPPEGTVSPPLDPPEGTVSSPLTPPEGTVSQGTVPAECQARFGDGEIGFNVAGEVIWFLELTDETFMKF